MMYSIMLFLLLWAQLLAQALMLALGLPVVEDLIPVLEDLIPVLSPPPRGYTLTSETDEDQEYWDVFVKYLLMYITDPFGDPDTAGPPKMTRQQQLPTDMLSLLRKDVGKLVLLLMMAVLQPGMLRNVMRTAPVVASDRAGNVVVKLVVNGFTISLILREEAVGADEFDNFPRMSSYEELFKEGQSSQELYGRLCRALREVTVSLNWVFDVDGKKIHGGWSITAFNTDCS